MLKSCQRVEVVKKSRGCAKKKMLRNRRWHYGGPQLSRQKKKPRGKRKRLTAKGRTLRQKGKDSRQKKKHHSKRKNLTAKRKESRQKKKNLLAVTLSFMPWGHCYFFRREVISFAVRLFLSLWVFYLDKPDNDMRTNYLTSVVIAQCLQKLYLPMTGHS